MHYARVELTSEILLGIDPSLRNDGISPPGEDLVAILVEHFINI